MFLEPVRKCKKKKIEMSPFDRERGMISVSFRCRKRKERRLGVKAKLKELSYLLRRSHVVVK